MARSQGGDYRGEGPGAVVRPVVGNDPHEPGDPVGGEEGPGTAEEADRGGGLRLESTAPVGPPASPGWDASDLLDVQVWTARCFSDSACLCFRLPSLNPGNRVRLRSGRGIPGLGEGGHDCMSARSMRQYP